MIRIESLDDARVTDYRLVMNPAALQRAGLFVAEGRFVVRRLLQLNRFPVRSVFVTPAAFADLALDGSLHGAAGQVGAEAIPAPVYVAGQSVMDGIVGFNIHRGCLAIGERLAPARVADLSVSQLRRVLILEGVGNPDNVGGLFRSAAAFGVDAVVLGPACADPLYRKSIRTSMAATLHVPFVDAEEWPQAIGTLREQGVKVLALTTAAGATPLDELPRPVGRFALLVGAEGTGLTAAATSAADEPVRISISATVDSLNVTVATSIALHYLR